MSLVSFMLFCLFCFVGVYFFWWGREDLSIFFKVFFKTVKALSRTGHLLPQLLGWDHRNLPWSLRGTSRLLVGIHEQRRRLDASTIPSCGHSSNYQIFHSHGGRCLIFRSKCASQAAVSYLLRGDTVGLKEGWFWSSDCQLDLPGMVLESGEGTIPACFLLMVNFWVWKQKGRTTPNSGAAQILLHHMGTEIKKNLYSIPQNHRLGGVQGTTVGHLLQPHLSRVIPGNMA